MDAAAAESPSDHSVDGDSDGDLDGLLDAAPLTDRVGLDRLERERARAGTAAKLFPMA